MIRHPLAAIGEAETFTRELHTAALDERWGVQKVVSIAAARLDAGATPVSTDGAPGSSKRALARVQRAIADADAAFAKALAPLSEEQLNLYP